jgi:protoporphyrinogen oxidase
LNDPGRVVVLGAGPTGLGAAWRLQELGVTSATLLEAGPVPGGLAASEVDARGFTWDVGGHVQFSHYAYYDDVLDRALGDAWLEHRRDAAVWVRGRWVPYPFQNNLHRLAPADRDRALAGLESAAFAAAARAVAPGDFREWILASFGEGIAELFLFPYNEKVWGYPLETLGVEWMGERVAVPDLEQVRRALREGSDDDGWGPNRRFRFPLRGGTGAIWQAVAGLLDPARLRFGARVVEVDLRRRRLRLESGGEEPYDALISTVPLDRLCERALGLAPAAAAAARALRHSSVHVVGVGLRGGRPPGLRTRCWMYFPEPSSPYYRVTVFSNYSPHHVPSGDGMWSLMAEVCETAQRPVDAAALGSAVVAALRRDGLVEAGAEVVSLWQRREEHGYPTPFLGRDLVLAALLPALRERRVLSRGRFGAWKYEVSNQDHSFMQGVEAVDALVGLGEEVTLERPAVANSGVFARRSKTAPRAAGGR